jgi:hypothetical protein
VKAQKGSSIHGSIGLNNEQHLAWKGLVKMSAAEVFLDEFYDGENWMEN